MIHEVFSSPVVRNFSFVVVYENNTSWDDRIELHQGWRRIVDKFVLRQRFFLEFLSSYISVFEQVLIILLLKKSKNLPL